MNASPLGAFDAHAALSPAQVVWIMDAMTAREVAWLRGGTLAQTIFTSLHYHNAQSLAPPPDGPEEGYATTEAACVALRAFVLAYAKAVDVAYGIVLDANGPARDGEDMWLDPYGVPLDTTETAAQVAAYVEQITQWLAQWQPHDDAWSQVVLRLQFRRVGPQQLDRD
jgi:hypothetical protein